MSRIIKPVLIFAAILLFPAVALAVDMDFYTYGGFEPVVDSFTQLSLIFGNTSYQTLYYTAVVAGIACGATAAYMSLIGGRGGNILGWAPIAALGIAIYVGLFVPKGNIVVYDPVFNKFQTIPNVPNGVVIVAGSLNAIERGLVEIVSNSASPTAYQTQAGGIGFMGLYNLTTMPATASNSFLDMNVNRYIQDCVSFALNNPGSGLTVDELRKTTTSFATSFSKASNPAIYTLYYSAAVPQGQAQGCDVDYAMVFGTDLTAVALQNNVNSACSTLNFDVTDPLQLNQCQTMVLNLATGGGLTAGNMDSLMQQIYLYHRLDQFYQSGNTTAITNYNFLLNASGSMKAADEWIPVLKAVLTAIAVALIPFLAIFIPTPICGKALNLMFGMFLWLALWGVCDAIIHQFAMSYGFKVWDAVRNNNLGMDALYFFPNMTVKALAMFGTLRMGGLLLATALTTMLTRFGGSVMGMLAGNITGQIQSAGVTGERATTDPSGRATSIESNTRAMPTEAWAASNPLSSREGELFVWGSPGGR
ncbi:MAG: conjugal transfer protein TraG N-terminal domain-containing protein [Geobacteraceae bacterium]